MSSRILPPFDLVMPSSLDEALAALDEFGKTATVMAGGTDVLVALKGRFRTEHIISLAAVDGLDTISFDPQSGLRLGAMVPLSRVLDEPVIKAKYPSLWQSAAIHGTPQTRERATVVGNILRGSPAGDCSCAVLAWGGSVVFRSVDGEREVSIDDMWPAYGQTARQPNELAVALRLPPPLPGTGSAFARLTRTNEDLAKLNASVRLDMEGKTCQSARIAMGCVGPTLVRLPKSEALLTGAVITEELLAELVETVPGEITPIDDVRSSAEYRLAVAGPYVRRLIRRILAD